MSSEESEQKLIERIISLTVKEFETNPNLYDKRDIDRIIGNSHMIKNSAEFVTKKIITEEALIDQYIKGLKWRKEFGINDRGDDYFPKEFFQFAAIYPYTHDKKGNRLIILRLKAYKKIKKLRDIYLQFFAHQLEKVQNESIDSQWALVFDFTGAGISNIDIDFLNAATQIVNKFPAKYAIFYNLHPAIESPIKMIMNTVMKTMKVDKKGFYSMNPFLHKEEIFEYIDADEFPMSSGGKCTKPMGVVPSGVKPFMEIYQTFGIDPIKAEKIYKKIEKRLKKMTEKGNGIE